MGYPPREVRLELVGIPRVRHRVRGRARDPARAAQEEEAGAGRNLNALMLSLRLSVLRAKKHVGLVNIVWQ